MPESKAQSISDLIAMYFNPASAIDQDSALVQKIEYLFSDEHLLTDIQMLIEIRKHNGTFVSLAFLLCHEEIRKLNVDKQAASSALRMHSKLLELNKDGSMVRRIEPVTNIALEPLVARCLLVENLPELLASSQTLSNLFSHFGSKVQVNVYHPQQAKKGVLGNTSLGAANFTNPNQPQTPYAVVLFDSENEADNMIEILKQQSDVMFGLGVSKLPLPKASGWNNSGKKFVRMVLLQKEDGTVGVELFLVQGQVGIGQHVPGLTAPNSTILSPRPSGMSPRIPHLPTSAVPDMLPKHVPVRRAVSAQLGGMLHTAAPFVPKTMYPQNNLNTNNNNAFQSNFQNNSAYFDTVKNYGFESVSSSNNNYGFSSGNIGSFMQSGSNTGFGNSFSVNQQIARTHSQQMMIQQQQQQQQQLQQQQQQLLQQQLQLQAAQNSFLQPNSVQSLAKQFQSQGMQWQPQPAPPPSPLTQPPPPKQSLSQLSTVRRSISSPAGYVNNLLPPTSLPPIENKPHLFQRNNSISERSAFKEMLNAWDSATTPGQQQGQEQGQVQAQGQGAVQGQNQNNNASNPPSPWTSVPAGFQSVQARNQRQQGRRDYAAWAAATPEMRAVASAGKVSPPQDDRKNLAQKSDSASWISYNSSAFNSQVSANASPESAPVSRPMFASRGDSAEVQVRIAKTPDGTRGFAAGRGRSISMAL